MDIEFHGGTDQSAILYCSWTEVESYRQIIDHVYWALSYTCLLTMKLHICG